MEGTPPGDWARTWDVGPALKLVGEDGVVAWGVPQHLPQIIPTHVVA